jgi:putative transposase
MVNYRRNLVRGGTYFFTVALANRRSSALVEHVDSLRQAFQKTRVEKPFEIDAIVILPDHLHAIITLPPADSDYSGRWRRLKSLFTRAIANSGEFIARDSRGEYQLWQRRFWEHTIRDDSDFERHVDYIHFNPVKHNLVPQVADWPHSSFHRYVRQSVLPRDWAGIVGSAHTVTSENLVADLGYPVLHPAAHQVATPIPDYASLHPGYRAATSLLAHPSLVTAQNSANLPATIAARMPAIRSW